MFGWLSLRGGCVGSRVRLVVSSRPGCALGCPTEPEGVRPNKLAYYPWSHKWEPFNVLGLSQHLVGGGERVTYEGFRSFLHRFEDIRSWIKVEHI